MTSKFKCPFCGEEIEDAGIHALIQSQQQLKMLEPIVASLQGRADINAEEARDSNELVAQWYEKYEQSQKDLDTARKALEYVKDAGLFVFAKIEAEKALKQIEHKDL